MLILAFIVSVVLHHHATIGTIHNKIHSVLAAANAGSIVISTAQRTFYTIH
jgi:hypothetical protein